MIEYFIHCDGFVGVRHSQYRLWLKCLIKVNPKTKYKKQAKGHTLANRAMPAKLGQSARNEQKVTAQKRQSQKGVKLES